MKTAKKIYKEWIIERAKQTKVRRKEHYKQVLSKEKVETHDDIIGLYMDLPKHQENLSYIVFELVYG
jgi:hypothetical protein